MPCKNEVRVKSPYTHIEVTVVPKRVYIIENHRGKSIKIGVFEDPKTGQLFRALLPDNYVCQ